MYLAVGTPLIVAVLYTSRLVHGALAHRSTCDLDLLHSRMLKTEEIFISFRGSCIN